MEIHYDIWLDNDGKAFGEECFRILEAIEKTGSLSRAATELNISYSGAFRVLKRSEEKLGFALLERKIGGASGGGSCLTPKALELMISYRLFSEELLGAVYHIYKKHFGLNRKPAKRVAMTE